LVHAAPDYALAGRWREPSFPTVVALCAFGVDEARMLEMSETRNDLSREQWQPALERITNEREGRDATIEVLTQDFGDGFEAERLPLSYVAYDPKDDVFIVAVGGRGGRYPVVLHHMIDHPQAVLADEVPPPGSLALEVIGPDDSRTVISILPGRSDPST
jgi:hypothetical protein